ncbi:MAG: hypothetical protein Q8P19_04465, partial [bacterium]|nr:hypothetical protein [bacterium]
MANKLLVIIILIFLLEAEYPAAELRGREANRLEAPEGASPSKKQDLCRPAKYLAPVGQGMTGRPCLYIQRRFLGVGLDEAFSS